MLAGPASGRRLVGDAGCRNEASRVTPAEEIDRTRPIASQVYDYLRRRIVDNRLSPGTMISEAELARSLEISRTPLRAALQQLAKEGLVVTRPQVGSVVAKLDAAQLEEAVFARTALETAVVRKLAETRADLSALAPVLALQAAAAEADDYATFFGHDEAFHATLATIAGVPGLWKLVQSVKGHVDRQRYTLMSSIGMRSRRAYDEHLAIVDRIAAGDADGAARAMADHVNSVLEVGMPGEEGRES